MKRGAIALAILIGLAFTLPLMGRPPGNPIPGHMESWGCDCSEGSGCTCDTDAIPQFIVPQFPGFLNALRNADFYYDEDDDYMYFKATEDSGLYEPDADGDVLMSFSFDFLEYYHEAYYTDP